MHRTTTRALSLVMLLLAVGCGGGSPPATTRVDDPLAPARLYPLGRGFVWSYDVDTGTELSTLAISRVVRAEGDRFDVSSGGDPIAYERRPEGIFRPNDQVWLLKGPIRVGAEWTAAGGRQARVTSVSERLSTPAGDFSGCVEVRETGGADGREVATTYCPDVGPVMVDASMRSELTGATARVVARLRGYSLE